MHTPTPCLCSSHRPGLRILGGGDREDRGEKKRLRALMIALKVVWRVVFLSVGERNVAV